MRSLGATVIEHGADFDEARERCSEVAAEQNARYIHSGNEPMLIAGVATATLELLQREPSIDAIVVPVGGGSGAAGACLAAKAIDSRITVVGVQSEAAPAAYRAWRDRKPTVDEMHTFAEGLQTRVSFDLPQRIMVDQLDDFILVSDDELRDATRRMLETTRTLVEPAGAAPLAAVLKNQKDSAANGSRSSAAAATSARTNYESFSRERRPRRSRARGEGEWRREARRGGRGGGRRRGGREGGREEEGGRGGGGEGGVEWGREGRAEEKRGWEEGEGGEGGEGEG